MTPELSVLIVNYNTWCECAAAVQSLREQPPTRRDGSAMPYECIVVDNCSPRRPPQQIEAVRAVLAALGEDMGDPLAGRLILHGENAGYSKGVNLAFRHSRGRWILVSNPDLVFPPGCIGALQRHLEDHPRAGCVVPKGYWDPDFAGRLPPNTLPTLVDLLCTTFGEFARPLRRWYGRRLARAWVDVWQAQEPLELRMMSGCLFLMERGFFESIGLMDERFPLYYEDADLSVRLRRAGRALVQVPGARVVHFVNRSGQTDFATTMARHDRSRALYYRKWYGLPGAWLLALCDGLLRARWLRRLRRPAPDGPWVDLGESDSPPRIELPRACERFLLLMSLDSRFYLSGGLFGSGAVWTPTPSMFANFSATVYWYRAYDLGGGGFRELGTWRYHCRRHLGRPVAETTAETVAETAEEPNAVAAPVLSVVVLSWNTRELTLACLRALAAETPRHAREVIVVDNGSTDGSADAVAAAFPAVRLLRNADNRLYAAGNNQGVAAARGEFVCTLNSDTEVRPGALDQLVDFLRDHPGHAAVAPRLVDPDGTVQRACQRFPTLLSALCFDSWWGTWWPGSRVQSRYLMRDFDHLTARDVPQPPGACLCLRRAEYARRGGLDEGLPLFFNDVDLCRRLWAAGRRVHYLASAEVLHHRGASTRGFDRMLVVWHRDRLAYYRKHYGAWAVLWLRVCIRLRIWEEWIAIGRRHRGDPGRASAERAHLRRAVQELWAS